MSLLHQEAPRAPGFALLVSLLSSTGLALAEESPVPAVRAVESIRLLHDGGGRVSWSAQGDLIAFDKRGPDGRYDIHLLRIEDGFSRCLTCEVYDLRKRHNLNPTWHPSGDFLVFQSQALSRRLGLGPEELATPDRGAHSDLFAIRVDLKDFWQLAPSGGAILDPQISHEGALLVWSERLGRGQGRWGEWTLRVGKLEANRKRLHLGRVRSFQPGEQKGLLIAHGFTPNDRGILLSGNLESGQRESGADIYLFDLEGGNLERLTHSRSSLDAHAHFSPTGQWIAWSSDVELRAFRASDAKPPARLCELWMMERDGSAKERVTFFNEASAPESRRGACVGDFAWSPRGDHIVAHVLSRDPASEEAIYLLRLRPEYRRP